MANLKMSWRAWHKWVGLFFSIFILMFCFSGIVLNHRRFFSSCEVSRWWLPNAYHIENWNQNVVRATLPYESGLLVYGQAGIWKSNSDFCEWEDFNEGIALGIDNRKITNVVQSGDGKLWCSALYEAYCYDNLEERWLPLELPNNEERISDIALRGKDTIVVLTRSALYEAVAPEYKFELHLLKTPKAYENKVSLFKTIWMLHSGELFGCVGRLVVDMVAVALIVLCLTGIVFFVLPYRMRKMKLAEEKRKLASWMKWNLTLHNRLGAGLIILTLILSVTGMCLRPPLMVPLAMTKTAPMPYSALDHENVFHDKLRAIRWDENMNEWLISTSDGFYHLDEDLLNAEPEAFAPNEAPHVSPMGVNVFTRNPQQGCESEWLVGSFSGLYRWNPQTGNLLDWFTGKPVERSYGRTVGFHAVTGWSHDLTCTSNEKPVVFEYSAAPSESLPPMPEVLQKQPMSLWNFALELHVGRCYEPFLGSVFSVLFIFLSGLLLTLTLISGYIIYRRTHKKIIKTK
ncbi:MAG: PepSY domain-containing protein [Paludibacteraceae bacterium]|nr:PepSY domain-containing protein [Paludibacteraceae bacterium]